MASTPDGRGYWLVASDGGIFSFGDARFDGSMGGTPLNAPVTGMAATANGAGYWLVASDGGIFAFGDAPFLGSMGGRPLNDPVDGMVASPGDGGYLMVATDGGIFGFGSISFYGSLGAGYGGDPGDVPPVAGIALTPAGSGYWLLEPDGWSYALLRPGGCASQPSPNSIVSVANSQVASDPAPRLLLQPLRALRGVVRPVRHLGVGAGRGADPLVPVHRQHLRLGRGQHRGAPAVGHARHQATPCSTGPGPGRPRPRCTWGSWCRSGRTVPS